MHCTCRTVLSSAFALPLTSASSLPPAFLVPAYLAAAQTSTFSTSSPARARKDGNPSRGVSALRRTGLKKQHLSVSPENLPRPVLDPAKRSQVEVDVDHGLWEFFPSNRTLMATPAEIGAHGRAWTVAELRKKDWDDLHRLWWTCLKEINRQQTFASERKRIGEMYGDYETDRRLEVIKKTMKAVKHTLTERWYAWDNARNEAMQDDEIDMYADLDQGQKAYLPKKQGGKKEQVNATKDQA